MRLKLYRSSSTGDINSPEPAAYNIVNKINPKGTYISSKNENVHQDEFSKDKTQKFKYKYKDFSGSSDYKYNSSMLGKIFDSRFKSTNDITIRPKRIVIDSRKDYPGPGAYKFFIAFGIYEKDDSEKN